MSLARTAFGAKRRQSALDEAREARQFETLLLLHRLDFWHCNVAQRSQPGWPDYAIFGDQWLAFVELKATSSTTGRRGKVSAAQYRYKEAIEKAGGEWRTFCLPDDWEELHVWLRGHTGMAIYETGSKRP